MGNSDTGSGVVSRSCQSMPICSKEKMGKTHHVGITEGHCRLCHTCCHLAMLFNTAVSSFLWPHILPRVSRVFSKITGCYWEFTHPWRSYTFTCWVLDLITRKQFCPSLWKGSWRLAHSFYCRLIFSFKLAGQPCSL